MGFFSNILEKLGIKSAQAAPAPAAAAPSAAPADAVTPIAVVPVSVVDVVAQLEAKAAASKEKLNWKTSIVDLLKLLGMDSSLAARKELAEELGYTGAKDGSAEFNIWLHKTVLQKIADNGGNVPKELLD